MKHKRLRARLTGLIEEFEHGRVSTDDFKSAVSLAGTLNQLTEIIAQAHALATTHGKHRIAQLIRRVNIDGDTTAMEATSGDAWPPLEAEPSWEFWEPFVFPVTERKIDEWFSNPQEARLIAIANVERLMYQLGELKARLSVGPTALDRHYPACCLRFTQNREGLIPGGGSRTRQFLL
jgi:hypothetical protein